MSLTDFEVRSLEEISDAMQRTDPRLARALARGTLRSRPVDVVTVVIGVLLLATLCIGIALHLRVVCAVAWMTVMAAAILRGMYADHGY